MSWGGLLCAIAVGNAIAALNWFSIANGFASSGVPGSKGRKPDSNEVLSATPLGVQQATAAKDCGCSPISAATR